MSAHITTEGLVCCENCGNKYDNVGTHWSVGECSFPKIEEVKKNAIVGLVLGDGNIDNRASKNSRLKVGMINYNFLVWLSIKFGWVSTGVRLSKTAEEKAKITERSGINGEEYVGDPDNFNDFYTLGTISHPFINTFDSWYSSGSKLWPEDINIAPTTLLMWFVGDGHYQTAGSHRRIIINSHNEMGREDKVENYFAEVDVPKPSTWSGGYNLTWTVQGSYELFDYMTESPWWDGPPPGFEYKFPENFGGTGKTMEDLET